MYDNFKLYNYSKSLVSPEGYGRHESFFLSGDIINGFETVIGTGLQVTTKPGNAIIRNGSGGTASAHLVSLTADFTVTLATADGSNPRIDAIVLYVDTSVSLPSGTPSAANLDGLGVAKIVRVTGTPNASPSAPSTAAIQSAIGSASYPYTVLSNWRVNAGVSTLSQDKCTDTRVFAAPTNPRALGQSSFIESGGVASFTNSTLNGSITSGTAWISVNGVLVPQPFNSLNFTMAASKDRYYYVTLGNSTIQAAPDATNGGVTPALPSTSAWIARIVSGASAITSTNDIRRSLVSSTLHSYGATGTVTATSTEGQTTYPNTVSFMLQEARTVEITSQCSVLMNTTGTRLYQNIRQGSMSGTIVASASFNAPSSSSWGDQGEITNRAVMTLAPGFYSFFLTDQTSSGTATTSYRSVIARVLS